MSKEKDRIWVIKALIDGNYIPIYSSFRLIAATDDKGYKTLLKHYRDTTALTVKAFQYVPKVE
jgi:hypothetical protein